MNRLLLFVFAILPTFSTVRSADRVALIVGNSNYQSAPLENPINDARQMGKMLKDLGFEVIEKHDLDKPEFTDAIRVLSRSVSEGGIALFFFAGHGLQVKGENFLVPAKADVEEEFDVEHECVALSRVLSAMESSQSDLNIVFLDCCRNNPYKRGWRRSSEKGLASTLVPEGTLISFAAAPGKEALDGTTDNSPFTEALLAHLPNPGAPLTDALMAARKQVYESTGKQQRPWVSHDLLEEIVLKAGETETHALPMKPVVPRQPAPGERLRGATIDSPFVNSLGMEFIPVPGNSGIYMCRKETRVRDFAAFVEATGYNATSGAVTLEGGRWRQAGGSWQNPRFPRTSPLTVDHPVSCVSWEDAKAFCEWLSKKSEEKDLTYRLPTDSEWSAAVGIGRYPWGSRFPPSRNAGNYAGREANIGGWSNNPTISNYDDGFPRSSPVGSFSENRYGFFDLGGNVFEWCEDRHRSWMNDADVDPGLKIEVSPEGVPYRVFRGGAWSSDNEVVVRSSFRGFNLPTYRAVGLGFRCVVN